MYAEIKARRVISDLLLVALFIVVFGYAYIEVSAHGKDDTPTSSSVESAVHQ